MKTINDLNLTELETRFINSLTPLLYAEPGFTDCELMNIANDMKVSIDVAKGVFGSLTKKGIATTDRVEHIEYKKIGRKIKPVRVNYELIILHSDYYWLHPRWANRTA